MRIKEKKGIPKAIMIKAAAKPVETSCTVDESEKLRLEQTNPYMKLNASHPNGLRSLMRNTS